MISDIKLIKTADFKAKSIQLPWSWIGHIPFARWVVEEVKPRIFVELGTHSGNSYFSFCQGVQESNLSTRCYAVDTWQGDDHSGHYNNTIFNQVDTHNKTYYSNFSTLLRMTFDEARAHLADGSIDLLHIDGLHTYKAVKSDFETWLPKLAPGAVVLFHDIAVTEGDFGVWKLWAELKERYSKNLEFNHSHGLGILQIDNLANKPYMAWLEKDNPMKELIQSYFSILGARQECEILKSHVSEITQLNETQKKLIEQLSQSMENLLNSRSWSVTKPLRWVSESVSKVFS